MTHNASLFLTSFCLLVYAISNVKSTKAVCGGRLTKPSGFLQTPNYPEKYDYETHCEWVIEAPVDHVIQLTFLDFDVEGIDTDDCDTDKVHVKNGENDSSPLLGNVLCGEEIPQMVTSTGRYMFISFTSDFISMGGRGFRASYTTEPAAAERACFNNLCGGTIEDTTGCTIQSPSYPSGYDANLNCSWLIKAPTESHTIVFEFLALQLDFANSNCAKNNITFYDGSNMHAPSISESVCDISENRLNKKVFKSSGSTMYVQLRTSEATKEYSGFNGRFFVLSEGETVTSLSNAVQATTIKTTPLKTTTKSSSTTVKNTPQTTTTTVSSASKTSTLLSTIKNVKSTTTTLGKSTTEPTTNPVRANDIVNNPAAMSGLVVGVIVGVAVLFFAALVVAYVQWKRRNVRFNLRLREEDARSDVNTLISSNDSREFDNYKNGKIVRKPETEPMYQQL